MTSELTYLSAALLAFVELQRQLDREVFGFVDISVMALTAAIRRSIFAIPRLAAS
jgi:hypothetical protein